jgi:hypothetical protein
MPNYQAGRDWVFASHDVQVRSTNRRQRHRMIASPAATRGLVTSSIPILFFPRKTFALISTLS